MTSTGLFTILLVMVLLTIIQCFANRESHEKKEGVDIFRYSAAITLTFIVAFPLLVLMTYYLFFYAETKTWFIVDYVQFFAFAIVILVDVFGYWYCRKFSIELNHEKMTAGAFRKKVTYFKDINEITLKSGRGNQLLIINKDGKCVLDISDAIQDFIGLVKAIEKRVPENQVMCRERDMWGEWSEKIIKR